MAAFDGKLIALVLLFFLLGTSNTIVTKVIFTLQGTGADGNPELFRKPAFGNWDMFFGMILVLIPYVLQQRSRRAHQSKLDVPLVGSASTSSQSTASMRKQVMLIAVPAIFDVLGTGLSLVGIILIPASVWQMLRGPEIIFAALLMVFVLRRKLFRFHYLGVCLAFAGICCVSYSTLANGGTTGAGFSSTVVAFGVGITILSQLVQACQIIAEEKLLIDLDMEPLLVVGVEGMWGLCIMTFIVYPILWVAPGMDHGHLEDPIDTIALIQSSSVIMFFVVMDFLSCAVYNVLGQRITKEMSGMMRVMLEATRTLFVWLFNLAWHYFVDPTSMFGEAWTTWSYLAALGFILLIVGQMTYGEVLKWPGFKYPSLQMEYASPLLCSPKRGVIGFASPH